MKSAVFLSLLAFAWVSVKQLNFEHRFLLYQLVWPIRKKFKLLFYFSDTDLKLNKI